MDCFIKIAVIQPVITNALAHSLRSLGQLYGRISLRSKAAPINLPSMRGARALEMNRVFSKVFISEEGVEFGVIRKASLPFPSEFEGAKVLAEDESGNYFIEIDEAVYFWDHETSKTEFLASSLDNFISGCSEPETVELKPDQVESVWVDPEFAKKFGIKSKP